jgi:hypothetical protein
MSEEKIDSSTNNEQEATENNENISEQHVIEQTETTNQTSEIPTSDISTSDIPNMEVHHHPHVEKKNFKEYFLEFVMIFIAVTLGFFAESYRENIVNKEKERHYMESIVSDLQKDTAEVNNLISLQNYAVKKMDSALRIPAERLTNIEAQDSFYHHFIYFYTWDFIFLQHDNTISQLKNAGGFSVIKDKDVIDNIGELQLNYDNYVKALGIIYFNYYNKVVELGAQLMDMPEPPSAFNDTLFETYPHNVEVFTQYNRPLLRQLYSWIRNEKGTLAFYMKTEMQYRNSAVAIINLIQKQYNIHNTN